jgi:VIT1/CCC1 family predicted Fe2+/Mn2+ transporter
LTGRAIQDYEFLGQHLQQPSQNQLTKFHTQLLPGLVEHIKSPQNAWDNGYMILGTSHRWKRAIFGRILAALLGGLALIAPMIIMSLDDSVEKSLITSSVFVVVVAIAVALASSGSWRDVLSFTAAYAAVLVVFVGTSMSSQNGPTPKTR